MRVLVIVVVVIVTWESKANSSSSLTELQTGTELGKKEKIMTFIVATNVVASKPSERRPTGTPHARANTHL